jgi:hypothetical protein
MGGRETLETVMQLAHQLAPEELPRFLGQLEEARVTAFARLSAPVPAQQQADELLGVSEASHRLGISRDYLYRHHGEFDFTRRQGKRLLFSASGIERYIRGTGALTPRRRTATVTP